jgi:hypothetical protein
MKMRMLTPCGQKIGTAEEPSVLGASQAYRAPELGQRIAKVFRGLRDLLIAAAESEFGIEPDWACGHAAS